ncbi:mucin-5AC [Xyrichtys novacula]|uniref:Mucin-5AC n=1 Tax=Xyrichtys novacula TaxID=13765 RepID=A0AAV1EYC3_XYRNO|nr:mucin-5AC [Xyrichtys novacula]
MKPDGVNMETTEPTEAAAEAEHSPLQENIQEQAPLQPGEAANDAAPGPAPKANGKPVAADPKAKPKAFATKMQVTAKSAGASRQVTTSQRTANDVKSSNNVSAAAARKTTTTTAKASAAAGAASKRAVGAAAVSTTVKNQTRMQDRKPAGAARTTTAAAATVTNGTKPTTANGNPNRRPVAETVRPKTTVTASRPAASTAPKPSTLATTKPAATATGAISKTTRPATAPSTFRPTNTTSRPTSTTNKPPTTTAAKTAASRTTTAPSTGRTTAAQTSKTAAAAAAKKDVSRPPPAAVAKKLSTNTASSAIKKTESVKPTASVKQNSASKLSTTTTKAADPKLQPKTKPPTKSAPAKKPVAADRFPAINKTPIGRTPPASPANKPTPKRGAIKPTQAVPPFTAKKTGVPSTAPPDAATQSAAAGAGAAVATVAAAAAAAAVLAEPQVEAAASLPQGSSSEIEEAPPSVLTQDITPEVPQEMVQSHVASPTQSLVRTSPMQEQVESSAPVLASEEQIPSPAEPAAPPVASSADLPKESVYPFTDQTSSTCKAPPAGATSTPPIVSHTNLNEEEDEEEREGSQLVSVSEMSGTTQPTEESRPGSAGLVGGSAWRASGALLSELDSEEVSGSQQGASELSAPGVLEGTESMDDLGDGSLKGAIDMEGASAGSPDFEKVPDIPVNDFDEDEEDDDDDDRVCDMDVGSERADEPQRPRHDNDVDDDEDEDVEMASEGVTESGLESYGNADEDDFAEDERLDNLNRVAQPPPPPPLLPSAPAAQWDQPNPFADPWAEPLQPQQVLENVLQPLQVAGAAATSPLADSWQADSETPTQTPAHAWLELGTSPFVPENQKVSNECSAQDEPHNSEARLYLDQSSPAHMQTLAPAPLSAPGMSLSSTLSSETSTPEELGELVKPQTQDAEAAELSPQPDQDLGIFLEKGDQEGDEEAEAVTLPADEVLGGPATAPTSNPSSSSVTEDEASDTEGEAQLDDSLEAPAISSITFDSQSLARRCLSTVEEGEEAEVSAAAGEDTTPPSATSLASYGFDTMTTASNSNAQSTGESCIKSPGIFSLEELSEEAKEPFLIPQPHTQLAEQQYIECGKLEAESSEQVRKEEEPLDPPSIPITQQQSEENPDDIQPPYYSAICEKTENSYTGFTALPHPHRRDHAAYPRAYCDIIKPHTTATATPKLTCADLPPRSLGQQALSPQLRRLEQHQRQLTELQNRREQQSRPLEEAEQERKRREEEEQRRKKDEAEEEIKRNKEELAAAEMKKEEEEKVRKEKELKQRRDLELQLQQQQEELKQRQQIMQWQQELQQTNKGQTVLLSPSSGLCTIYEALENSDEEEGGEDGIKDLNLVKKKRQNKGERLKVKDDSCERGTSENDQHQDISLSIEDTPPPPPPRPDSPQTPSTNIQEEESLPSLPPESPERPPPLELDWGKKVDIVQQLINQTLMLNRDGCSSLLLLPGGAGGTLSPLESSLWPSLLPPLTPPSATVTSVSSFSPEATGSSPQGEWTVVELETHH